MKASWTSWRPRRSKMPSPIGWLSWTSRPAPKPSSTSPRKRPVGDSNCPKGPAVASPCSSCSGPIWRKLPRLRYPRMARFVSGASSARWIAAVVNPTVRAGSGAIIFGITARSGESPQERPCRADQPDTYRCSMSERRNRGSYRPELRATGHGRAGTSAIVPAVTNAIFAATGKRTKAAGRCRGVE